MKKFKALIADDSKLMCDLIDAWLIDMDFENNVVVHDGKQAVLAYEKHDIDLVFLDLTMPILNGINVLKAIMNINPSAFVIIVSGNATTDNVKQVYKLGAKGFVVKPCDTEKFSQAVAVFLSDKK